MQQFVVPQFIDVEDKIIGPVTVRQFIIVLVGGGFSFVAYKLSDFSLFVFLFAIIMGSSLIIAFIKINGRPIHYFLLNVIQTLKRPKIRIWRKELNFKIEKQIDKSEQPKPPVPKKNHVRVSRLAEMALIVDTGGVYQGEELLNLEKH